MISQLPLFDPPPKKKVNTEVYELDCDDSEERSPDLVPADSTNWQGLPYVNDADLYKSLDDSYSASDMFNRSGKSVPKAWPIKAPVEHNGKFYVSFGGSCAPCRENSRGEQICIMECYATRLYSVDEYEGSPREFVGQHEGPLFYRGLLVVDPSGHEWVVGAEEFIARAFELANEMLVSDPEIRMVDPSVIFGRKSFY